MFERNNENCVNTSVGHKNQTEPSQTEPTESKPIQT